MRRPSTTLRLVAVAGVSVLAVSACSSSDDDNKTSDTAASSSPCGTDEDVTLTMGLFGTMGFNENGLYDQYKTVCPNVTIQEDVVEQSADYWTRLKTRLASGSGLADVQAIEIGFVSDVVQNHADQFVNWNEVPNAAADKAEFYDWKWGQASSADGSDTVGLGTDIGPMSMCYREDLLKAAGMPSTPDEVAKEWTTWDDFIAYGKDYTDKTGDAFIDSAASIFSTAVYQGDEAYNNADGQPDVENSDGVQTAWGYATEAAEAGITAGLSQFSDPWNKAFSSGSFAAIACPTWMMGYIQGQAGDDFAGKWNVSPVLPGGGGNWGGSWLGVPKDGPNEAAAIALVEWLSAKDQQVTMWTSKAQGGHFPSNQDAGADPSVTSATSDYFSGAPTGEIFGGIASNMSIPPIGVYDTLIQNAITTQLTNVETKGTSPDDAWQDSLDAIQQITG